jgi:hypothetical protein
MNSPNPAASLQTPTIPNGSGAAAILAAGIGSFALAVLAMAGDKLASLKRILDFYNPTGPLSGVTTAAILIWLLAWGVLEWRWRGRTVAVGSIGAAALALLLLSLIVTFPPIAELF